MLLAPTEGETFAAPRTYPKAKPGRIKYSVLLFIFEFWDSYEVSIQTAWIATE